MCFSPFIHSTGSLSVSYEYLALPDGPGRFTQDFSCPALLRITLRFFMLRVQDCHFLRCHFPETSTHMIASVYCGPTTPSLPRQRRFGLFPGRSPLLGESFLFSFPAGTKMFQFPAFASCISRIMYLQYIGLSHSEIHGSKVICTSP